MNIFCFWTAIIFEFLCGNFQVNPKSKSQKPLLRETHGSCIFVFKFLSDTPYLKMSADPQTHRAHRAPHSGPSAVKKKNRDLTKKGVSTKGKNLKAFTYSSHRRAARDSRRNLDRGHRKEHLGIANRANDVPAPYVIGVVGPPGVGKSTLVKSLVKHYTKQSVTDPKGPITVVTGKKRRITLIECPNHLSAMIDVAKVCDLVLLLVDASFGFEMETFEFLNILKNHGFPKVIGVLTHLDG